MKTPPPISHVALASLEAADQEPNNAAPLVPVEPIARDVAAEAAARHVPRQRHEPKPFTNLKKGR